MSIHHESEQWTGERDSAEPSPRETTSPRSLIAQWRENADAQERASRNPRNGDVENEAFREGAGTFRLCAEQLEAALKQLADLEAEMRRFAEGLPSTHYSGQQALAWAERLKALQ